MFLIASLGFATWILISICVGLLFGRMATLEERSERVAQARPKSDRLRAAPTLQLDRDRAA